MKKGITPIVSIIILLLITVALAGAAFTFLQGYFSTYTDSNFRMEDNMILCVKNGSHDDLSSVNVITVQITNAGQSLLANSDFSIIQIDGLGVDGALLDPGLAPGSAGILIEAYDCGGTGCSEGAHTVSVGTAAGVTTKNAVCPY